MMDALNRLPVNVTDRLTATTTISDVEVFGRGPLRYQGDYLIESFAYPRQKDEWIRERGHWRASLERVAQTVTDIQSPAVWITDNWSCGYFHWIGDALSRLELASRTHDLSELILLLPYKYRPHAYMTQSLEPFGLKEIRFLNRFERAVCRNLILPPHVRSTGDFDPSIVDAMRNRFRTFVDNAFGPTTVSSSARRVYISRSVANKRRVKNEAEIMPVLKKHGFEYFTAETHDWKTQTRIAANADMIVSNHGAGLTNIINMSPGSSVLEILDDTLKTPACYRNLSNAAGLNYRSMPASRHNSRDCVHKGDMVVDPERLDAAIASMIRVSAPAA